MPTTFFSHVIIHDIMPTSRRNYQAYNAAHRCEHSRSAKPRVRITPSRRASRPSSADRPRRGTPHAKTNRDGDDSDNSHDGNNRSDDERGGTGDVDNSCNGRFDQNKKDGWTEHYSERKRRPYYYHAESGRSVWAKPIEHDTDRDWDAIWKDVEEVEARFPAARRQDADKRHNDVYDNRSAKMQSDKAERCREAARIRFLIAGPPHADVDKALVSIADY